MIFVLRIILAILFTFQSSPLQCRDDLETMDLLCRGGCRMDVPATTGLIDSAKKSSVEQQQLTTEVPEILGKEKKGDKSISRYKCTISICGYVYDPAIGDEKNGVKAGTAFVDLPEDWICPWCGASQDRFEPIS